MCLIMHKALQVMTVPPAPYLLDLIDLLLGLFRLRKHLPAHQQSFFASRVHQLSLVEVTPKWVPHGVFSYQELPNHQFELPLWQVRLPISWGSLAIQEVE